MSIMCVLTLLCLAIQTVSASVTIRDWRGASVAVEEGVVDSDGVRVVYHTAGEGPLVILAIV